MGNVYSDHGKGLKGRHPGSSTGPALKGSGAYHAGLHYIKGEGIAATNRVSARVESPQSPKAVNREGGRTTAGRSTPKEPKVRGYRSGGEVEG